MRPRIHYTERATCPRCGGDVPIHVTDDPGRTSGDPDDCWPPEYSAEPQECSECGASDWTDDEVRELTADAERDEPDTPDDDPRYDR